MPDGSVFQQCPSKYQYTVDGRIPAPPKKPWNDDSPYKYQQTMFPTGSFFGAGFRPPTVVSLYFIFARGLNLALLRIRIRDPGFRMLKIPPRRYHQKRHTPVSTRRKRGNPHPSVVMKLLLPCQGCVSKGEHAVHPLWHCPPLVSKRNQHLVQTKNNLWLRFTLKFRNEDSIWRRKKKEKEATRRMGWGHPKRRNCQFERRGGRSRRTWTWPASSKDRRVFCSAPAVFGWIFWRLRWF